MSSRRPLREIDPAIRAELNRLLSDGRHTIRAITEHLQRLGAEVSKSSVGRYAQLFEEEARDMRMTREIALSVGRELEGIADSDVLRMLIESLQTLIFQAKRQMSDTQEFDAKGVADLCKALKDLQLAAKASIETRARIRTEERAEASKDAAAAAEKVSREAGLSATTIDTIKAAILGIKETHATPPTA